MTLLQPRKNVPFVVTTSKRGEPPWHWLVLASVNDAEVNVCPSSPVMSAPAAAFVDVAQFFSRWSTPLANDAFGHPVLPGSKTPGTSAPAAVPASASAAAAAAAVMSRFMRPPLWLPGCPFPPVGSRNQPHGGPPVRGTKTAELRGILVDDP